jgi:DNA replication and repair protein RecF
MEVVKLAFLKQFFLLGRGRSFKQRDLRLVVNRSSDELIVSASLKHEETLRKLGVKRSSRGNFEARCDGKKLHTSAQLAHELPLQLLDAHSFSLVEGGPKQRRQFLDWGVFHVEHGYASVWQSFQKVLKQRNQLLRQVKVDEESLNVWTREFIPLNEKITLLRKQYLVDLEYYLGIVTEAFSGVGQVQLSYAQGWTDDICLSDVLDADRARDMALGVTSHGAHKADMIISVDGVAAMDCLSRGQQKLLVYALKLAQAAHYQGKVGRTCIFLLDDLPAELDCNNRSDIIAYLNNLGCQYFITGVNKENFTQHAELATCQMFHVEHGIVTDG